MNKEKLKANYKNACQDYLQAFCEKHEYDFDDTDWVGDQPGSIAAIADYFVDMQTIIDDIELEAPEEEFLKWYDYCLEMRSFDAESTPNFQSWVKGCPRRSQEEINSLKSLREKIEGLKSELGNMLNKSFDEILEDNKDILKRLKNK